MRERDFDAFVVPSTDPHGSEYVAEHWMSRQWITGFTGSAGTAIVTLNDAALWVDSRYWIAAEEQMEDTPFRVMRQGHPQAITPAVWLKAMGCRRVACDPWVNDGGGRPNDPEQIVTTWIGKQTPSVMPSIVELDPFETIWQDRPALPQGEIEVQPEEWTGENTASKLKRIRRCMRNRNADTLLLTALDDIAWLLNLRGSDVHCTPVFVAYMLVRHDSATVYTYHKLPYIEGVTVKPYDAVLADVAAVRGRLQYDPQALNLALQNVINCARVEGIPTSHLKAVKSSAEIQGFRSAMLKDGVAMVKFLRQMDEAMQVEAPQDGIRRFADGTAVTEMGVDTLLTALRAEQEGFCGLSFDTIAGYGTHGAIVHYEATPETDIAIEPHGLLLLDSGAQYVEGTTDITRTIALGPLTENECLDYTLVLKGHIDLARACFPLKTTGTHLDVLARMHLWRQGLNYGHGTGHGVGSRLSVHEGPHQIRANWMPAPLVPGMTVTNEPGLYREGEHGVRIENTMLIVPLGTSPLTDSPRVEEYCEMEPLTLCPIDKRPIVASLLEPHHIDYLNRYHAIVWDMLSPLLNGEDLEWLRDACSPI